MPISFGVPSWGPSCGSIPRIEKPVLRKSMCWSDKIGWNHAKSRPFRRRTQKLWTALPWLSGAGGSASILRVDLAMSRSKNPCPPRIAAPLKGVGKLAGDVRQIIESSRIRVARSVSAELVRMNWRIGVRIHRDVVAEARAAHGEPNCLYTVETINGRIWRRVQPPESRSHGPFR